MIVFIVIQYRIPNSLTNVIGVFSSEALAEERIKKLEIEYRKFIDFYEWHIEEHEVFGE